MLFWCEKQKDIYLGVGFENGFIKIVNNLLMNNSIIIKNKNSYIDGAWHILNVYLSNKNLQIVIDNYERTIETFSESNYLIDNGDTIYIGNSTFSKENFI